MPAQPPTPPRAPLLSAALILGAPRTTLVEMFFSLLDTVNELSVVYTEGRDGRVAALCAEAELPLVERELPSWDGDFAAARNVAAEQAGGTYVLAIDDDERLVGGETLRGLLAPGYAPRLDAGLWDEVICWGPVYGHALRKLGQGFSYTFDVARPRARHRQPVEVGFVHERDLVRFLRWWCDDVEGSP